MMLLELDKKVLSLETQVETLKIQARKIYDTRNTKTSVMPKEYYRLLKERQRLETELRPLWNEQSRLRREILKNNTCAQKKIFVNSFGEAAKREITSVSYQMALKGMEQAVCNNIGV